MALCVYVSVSVSCVHSILGIVRYWLLFFLVCEINSHKYTHIRLNERAFLLKSHSHMYTHVCDSCIIFSSSTWKSTLLSMIIVFVITAKHKIMLKSEYMWFLVFKMRFAYISRSHFESYFKSQESDKTRMCALDFLALQTITYYRLKWQISASVYACLHNFCLFFSFGFHSRTNVFN